MIAVVVFPDSWDNVFVIAVTTFPDSWDSFLMIAVTAFLDSWDSPFQNSYETSLYLFYKNLITTFS